MNTEAKPNRWKNTWVMLTAVAVAFFLIGYWANSPDRIAQEGAVDKGIVDVAAGTTEWTCSMHPQIRQRKPGLCPLCGMDLIPVEDGSDGDLDPGQLKMSPRAMKLAAIQTAPVERRYVAKELRLVGKVVPDEKRVGVISSWVSGRIDRMFVDYTGVAVEKGDHLVEIYSPELFAAQEELAQAARAVRSGSAGLRASSQRRLDAAREKLRLYGLKAWQTKEIERKGKPSDRLTIYSPMRGIVIRKQSVEGMYVKTGTPLYTIADLSQVWVMLDSYESDLSWLRYGQEVQFETESYPGEVFNGRIVFIDPVLDPATRTVKLRVNVPNDDLKLKPEMFVRAVVSSTVSKFGRVIDPKLAGKWISPMHPEIVRDGPGKCSICGMPLVRAEDLGYVSADAGDAEPPIVIPATAALVTGKRAVVYVADPAREGVFQHRQVVLGPRAGDHYVVLKGLKEGEQVVVNGNFDRQ
jgi:Cu(I)/Ag(I) efflux system membrane fusion protein